MNAALITHQFSTTNPTPKPGRHKSPYSQALELQELLMNDARQPNLNPVSRAIIARAWRDMEAIKREIKMKPKPKPVDVPYGAKRKASSNAALSMVEDATPAPTPAPPASA